eukprot:scaffold65300_cov43-Phaeocystis_antarctica.AAC.1
MAPLGCMICMQHVHGACLVLGGARRASLWVSCAKRRRRHRPCLVLGRVGGAYPTEAGAAAEGGRRAAERRQATKERRPPQPTYQGVDAVEHAVDARVDSLQQGTDGRRATRVRRRARRARRLARGRRCLRPWSQPGSQRRLRPGLGRRRGE